ncbi:MAG: adenylate/guanylate cyclase domain-containing protein [Acidimicrobiia bacterium]
MCFLDLTGYTRLTEERGDAAAADLARSLSTMVQQHSVRYGGTAVKWLGDGVMFHFPEPGNGVLAALDMVDAAPDLGLPSAHVGLHAGAVLFEEGDYFGRTVDIAARIADYARPGEVVVSQEVVDASDAEAIHFREIGAVELKACQVSSTSTAPTGRTEPRVTVAAARQ